MSINFKIDLHDIKDSVVRRMLREAVDYIGERQKPMHKRGKKESPEEEDDDAEEQDDENDRLVELHQSRGAPAPIPAVEEDFPEPVAEKLQAKKPTKKKKV